MSAPYAVNAIRMDILDSLESEPMSLRDLEMDTGRKRTAIVGAVQDMRLLGYVEGDVASIADSDGGRPPMVWELTDLGREALAWGRANGASERRYCTPPKPNTRGKAPKAKPTSSASGAPESSQGVPEAGGPSALREADVVAWVLADHRRMARMAAAMRDVERERAIIRALVEHVAATVVDLASELSEIPVRVIRAELERLHADGVVLCDGDWWSLAPVGRVA